MNLEVEWSVCERIGLLGRLQFWLSEQRVT